MKWLIILITMGLSNAKALWADGVGPLMPGSVWVETSTSEWRVARGTEVLTLQTFVADKRLCEIYGHKFYKYMYRDFLSQFAESDSRWEKNFPKCPDEAWICLICFKCVRRIPTETDEEQTYPR